MSFNYMNYLIKNLIKLHKLMKNSNFSFGIEINNTSVISCILNDNPNYFKDIITCFNIFFCKNKKEKCEFIYDAVCDYLDNEFSNKKLCQFHEGTCIANRKGSSQFSKDGCCYSYNYSFGGLSSRVPCQHLSNTGCTTKNIACKFNTCFYLRYNGIQFKIKDILLLKRFFNLKQLLVVKCNHFKTKEQILDKLSERNYMPFIIYYLTNSYLA